MKTKWDVSASSIQGAKVQLAKLNGRKRLAYLLKLNLPQIAKFHSLATADGLINENLDLIEASNTIEAAQLLAIKAFFSSMKVDLDEAKIVVDKAHAKSRAVKSRPAEAMALAIKGYHKDCERQHEKAAVWYIMALKNIPDLYKADVLRELGASYAKQGKYELAWDYFNKTIKQTEEFIKIKRLPRQQKDYVLEIQADTLSRLATIHEAIDDLDGAEAAHDKAIHMARENDFKWTLYKALSRKVKFFILKNELDAAQKHLVEAESLSAEKYDPRVPYYVKHDWARLHRLTAKNNEDLRKSLDKYEEILYGVSATGSEMDEHILTLMKNMPILFEEVTTGIYECFAAMNEKEAEVMANELKDVMVSYDKALTACGLYVEIYKQEKLEIEERAFLDVLERIFQKAREIRYKGITAKYGYTTEKVLVTIAGSDRKFTISKRAFLIFEYMFKHKDGKGCVTQKEIEEYWKKKHEPFNPESSGFSTSFNRDVKKRLGLAPYIVKCPKPQGWRLLP